MKNLFTSRISGLSLIGATLAFLFLAGCGGSNQGATKPEVAPTPSKPAEQASVAYAIEKLPGGIIDGRVLLKGKVPPPHKVVVHQDPDVCGSQREIDPVRVVNGGVVDAVVSIDDIQRGKPFSFAPPVLQQKRCTYLPHVLLMQPGELKIESEDPVPHNVHTYAENNRDVNQSMNQLHPTFSVFLPRPDRVSVRCDLHGWMQAYVVVAKNPYYALTHEGGKFELDGVPAGRYQLTAWDPVLGQSEQEVTVEPGKTTKVDFTFESKPAQAAGSE